MFPQLASVLDADKILKRYEVVKKERLGYESRWRRIHQITDPTTDVAEMGFKSFKGAHDSFKLFSSDINSRLDKVVSRFFINLTDPSTKWFSIKLVTQQIVNGLPLDLSQIGSVQDWVGVLSDVLFNMTCDATANFYGAAYSIDENCFRYGNGCMETLLRADNKNIKFNSVNIFEVYPNTNGYGEIDEIFRKVDLNLFQAFDLWGENLHESDLRRMGQAYTQGSPKMDFVDVSMRNPLYGSVPLNLQWLSVAIDVRNRHVVNVEQFEFPKYQYIRFKKHDGEVYGKSPLWIAMPDAMVVNNLTERLLQAADYAIVPPIVVKDENSIPGGKFMTPMSYVQGINLAGQVEMQPLQFVSAQALQPILQFMELKLANLDQTLSAMDEFIDSGTMTAREVTARQTALMTRFRPFLVMLEQDFLYPVLSKSLTLLNTLGQLPAFPYEAVANDLNERRYLGMEWNVEGLMRLLPLPLSQLKFSFCGKMAKLAQINVLGDYQMVLDECVKIAQLPGQQAALLTFNGEGYLRELSEVFADNNPEVINSREKVEYLLKQQAEAQQAQAAMQEAAANSQMLVERLNALAKIPPETMSKIDDILA
jgi:hypothetical protein